MIDTHTHLTLTDFRNDLDPCIVRAKMNNVSKMVLVSIDIESSLDTIKLANKYIDTIYPAVGIHPSRVDSADIIELEKIISTNKVVAIGECGIDLYWTSENIDKQIAIFKSQIKLALKYDLPLIIHTRNSFMLIYDLLLPYKGKINGVFHCFTGTFEEAELILDLGFYLGIGGIITFKNAGELAEILKKIALEHLLLETDCPYLAPTPFRGKRNEPSYLSFIIEKLAHIKDMSVNEVDKITTDNAKKLFRIID